MRRAIEAVCPFLRVSQRRACRVLGQARGTQRDRSDRSGDEERLVERIVELALQYGRCGYRRMTVLLQWEGWRVNHTRVERLGRREGLKGPRRQPKRRRFWLTDGSWVRLRPQRPNHVWSYDFLADRTAEGRAYRMLTVLNEYTRESLAIVVGRRLGAEDVQACLTELFLRRGLPAYLRSDNGAEFKGVVVKDWVTRLGVGPLFIEPGSPWENGYIESFHGKLRDELLTGEIFDTLQEAKVLVERWRRDYNTHRPHSALGYRPPAPEALAPWMLPPSRNGGESGCSSLTLT